MRAFNYFFLCYTLSIYCTSLFGVVDFSKQVLPILEERCVECHKSPYMLNGKIKEPKAGLRLDGAAHIMFGGDGGVVVVANHPSQSSLYQRVILPFDDSEHMPPKGDPLTYKQQEILRKWIAQGIDFGKWEGQVDGVELLAEKNRVNNAAFVPEYIKFYNKLSEGMQPIAQDEIDRIAFSTKLMIRRIGIGNPLLEARVVTNPNLVYDQQIMKLLPFREHLTKLDLRNTRVSNRSLVHFSSLPRLTELNLRGTEIGDAGLANLKSLPVLQTLNLSETKVSDKGLKWLSEIKSLRQVFLWGSQVTADGRLRFSKKIATN